MFEDCRFVNENDGSLHYSDGWNFSISDSNHQIHTVHFTQTPGSSLSLMFNASQVVAFCLVSAGSSPPQASYSIDGSPPTSPHIAATSACLPTQQLFNSGILDAAFHNLIIEVTVASNDQPYILNYLWLCEAGFRTLQGSTAEAHNKTLRVGTIIGIILGTFALLLSIVILVWLYIRWRTSRLKSLGHTLFSPSTHGTVTPFPVPTRRLSESQLKSHAEVLIAAPSFLEEGTALSGGSASAVDGDDLRGPPQLYFLAESKKRT